MMNVNLVAFGKLKEKFFRDACEEYVRRLSAYAKITVKELEPAFLPKEPSRTLIDAALESEAEKLRGALKNGYKIALCVEGKQLSSEELALKLEKLGGEGISAVDFIVGSSYGLSENFKKECDFRLSMSPMTFPHELARVMLAEQIYRAFSIIGNSKYHK